MSITTISCDRCGDDVEARGSTIHIQCGPLRRHHPAVNLCRMCAADLAAWLTGGRAREREPQPAGAGRAPFAAGGHGR